MISYQFRIVYTGFRYALEALKVYQAGPAHQRMIVQAISKEPDSYKNR